MAAKKTTKKSKRMKKAKALKAVKPLSTPRYYDGNGADQLKG